MDKNEIESVELGMRIVKYVKGQLILKYVPHQVLPILIDAIQTQGYDWNDQFLERCKLTRGFGVAYKLMYNHEPIRFNGRMLFWYWEEKEESYITMFAGKGALELGIRYAHFPFKK